MTRHTEYLIIALALLAAAIAIGVTGIFLDRREQPKARPAGQHTRRGLRRAARAAQRSEDDQTIAWLAGLKRRVPALAIGRARVAGLLAVLPAQRAAAPACAICGVRLDRELCEHGAAAIRARVQAAPDAGWMTAPGPWDTDEARAELVPLPPVPVDLARLAGEYAGLFGPAGRHPRADVASCVFCGHMGPVKARHGGDLVCADDTACLARGARQLPAAELTVVDLTVVDPPPNARAGYWQPRAELPAPKLAEEPELCTGCGAGDHCDGGASFCECTCGLPADWADRAALAVLDFDPAADPPGWRHLRYPWSDQVVADFDHPKSHDGGPGRSADRAPAGPALRSATGGAGSNPAPAAIVPARAGSNRG